MRGHNVLGPLGVVLAVLLIATQVLVVYNYRNKLASRNIQEGETAVDAIETFDQADFEEEVVTPLKQMVKKFPDHPDMVIRKLTKQIHTEESRYAGFVKQFL